MPWRDRFQFCPYTVDKGVWYTSRRWEDIVGSARKCLISAAFVQYPPPDFELIRLPFSGWEPELKIIGFLWIHRDDRLHRLHLQNHHHHHHHHHHYYRMDHFHSNSHRHQSVDDMICHHFVDDSHRHHSFHLDFDPIHSNFVDSSNFDHHFDSDIS